MASMCAAYPVPMEPGMSALAEITDERLMGLVCDGRDEALAELVRRYQNDVFRFCLHYVKNVDTAKEMGQETFLRVYAARERFDVSRSFKPWLLCIARNLCLNEIKRKKAVQMESFEEYASEAREDNGHVLQFPDDSPSEQVMAQERLEALREALDRLPDDAREIVTLRYFQRMSARDIAEVVDSTEGAVRTRLHRVLKKLRTEWAPFKEEL